MKHESYALLIFLIVGSLTNVLVTYDVFGVSVNHDYRDQVIFTTSYTPHNPIVITNNSDFVIQGWTGNGTADEPYVIENLSITNVSVCIMISNTNIYFEIRECFISASGQSENGGIVFDNVTHGMVNGCIIDNHQFGIFTVSSSNCTIIHNIATDSFWGYRCDSSSSITLINNSASNCDYGFTPFLSSCTMINNIASQNDHSYHLYEASFCNLTDNLAIDNSYGFNLYYSNSCVLVNNTSYGNTDSDFSLYESSSCTLIDNSGWGRGLYITGPSISHWLHEMSGNTVKNQSIGYFNSISNITINSELYGQMILANCSSITLKNGIFNSVSSGVRLGFCSNCTLTNITVTNSVFGGFFLYYSVMCVLSNNTITCISGGGFQIYYSTNCTLTNNIASSYYWSAFTLFNSSSCTLANNIAFNNTISGFKLEGSSNCTLMNNTAFDNGVGFSIIISVSCDLSNNTASENGSGFSLFVSSSCLLTKNIAMNNTRGIRLSADSTDDLIFLNLFFLNSEYNAYDDGFSNQWDNGTHGNYWDDYDGSGTYSIPGSAESLDNHPYLYGNLPPVDSITTTIITTTTITTTTTTTDNLWTLQDFLITGISIISASIIGLVLFLTIRARRTTKTST